MATIKEVAQAAGVSVMTASRVARGMDGVKESTRQNVLSAMQRLQYEPDRLARALRNKSSNTIGIVVADAGNSFYTQVNALMEQMLRKKGYSVLMSFSNEDAEMELSSLSMLSGARVDGMVLTPVRRTDDRALRLIEQRGLQVLQLYRRVYEELDSLVIDDSYGVQLATSRLLEEGHQRILLLDVNWTGRADGYRKAFAQHGMMVDEDMILSFDTNAFAEEEIIQAIGRLHPSAIVAGTNILGYATVTACRKLMLDIPRDISVIVQDDVQWVTLMDMTAICQPMHRIAQETVELLLQKLQGEQPGEQRVHRKIRPSLVMRSSVRPG